MVNRDRIILEFLGSFGIFCFSLWFIPEFGFYQTINFLIAAVIGVISFILQELNIIPYPFKPK